MSEAVGLVPPTLAALACQTTKRSGAQLFTPYRLPKRTLQARRGIHLLREGAYELTSSPCQRPQMHRASNDRVPTAREHLGNSAVQNLKSISPLALSESSTSLNHGRK